MKRTPKLQSRLLKWYQANRRDLPWREVRDPYATWVSEIMLQQTQVDTVVAYFNRFMQRFPNLEALATASIDEVLNQWQGLGYYARARNLHASARQVVAEYGGQVPSKAEELRRLPGLGPYTAGAIASIAFGQLEPAVDGNVERVLCRLFAMRGDPKKNPTRKRLWSLAETLVKEVVLSSDSVNTPGDFNQALMELGATLCTPLRPECSRCPVEALCEANRLGETSDFPQVSSSPTTIRLDHVAALIFKDGKVLIGQRPLEGVWGGLWEFPRAERSDEESLESAATRGARELVGLDVTVERELTPVVHSFTHHRITLHSFCCRHNRGRVRTTVFTRCAWVKPRELDQYAFPVAQRKLILRSVNRGKP